jgi:transcriptional regulator GlxA family with amidase domain
MTDVGSRHLVAVLVLDGVLPMDLGIPARVFNAALGPAGEQLYTVATCSLGGRPVRTNQDFTIVVEHDERLLARADTVVLATQEPGPVLLATGEPPAGVAAALALIPDRTRIVSLCTSAFLLAAAGLLDGLGATTHWALADDLARLFPRVAVDPRVLFVDNGRVLTSAGGAAALDLCLHLVRRDHGARVANGAARRCVVAPWRDGGQAQFIERPVPEHDQDSTSRARSWALERLADPLTLEDLARQAMMSTRTFTRRFRDEVGVSPHQWLVRARVDRARQLLESTTIGISQIATECGFADAVTLRKHLLAETGLNPTAYRLMYSTPAPAV